jgi:hypothetical protein
VGLILSGLAFLIVVLRLTPIAAPTSTLVAAGSTDLPSDDRLAAALQEVIRDPSVTGQLQEHLIEWVEGEQFRAVQEELAAYIRSDDFHRRLVESFNEVRLEGVGANQASVLGQGAMEPVVEP